MLTTNHSVILALKNANAGKNKGKKRKPVQKLVSENETDAKGAPKKAAPKKAAPKKAASEKEVKKVSKPKNK